MILRKWRKNIEELDLETKAYRYTFIYNIQENNWTEGPPLLTARYNHSSCAIKSEGGTTESIIIIGGEARDREDYLCSTEILKINEQKWVPGPDLPKGISKAVCIELPFIMQYACLIIGGKTFSAIDDPDWSSNVYGLNKSLLTWTFLGEIKNDVCGIIDASFL